MANRKIFYLFIAVAGLALLIVLTGRRSEGAEDEFRFDAVSLKDTSLWTKVNAEPYRISVAIDSLCRAPTADDYAPYRKANPHTASFITVYVNNIGREAMFAKQVQQFPCSSCGADLVYEPQDGLLTCSYCGHKEAVAPSTAKVEERPFDQYVQLRPEQMGQLGSTVQEDLLTEIDPVEVKQIEGTEDEVVGT